MGNVLFYKDAIDTFECDIEIDGASVSESKSRLVLEFSNRTLLFTGTIEDGHVSISIPRLSEISDKEGTATLEIIADQTYFEAWTSPFELKNKKNVAITEVKINDSSKGIHITNVSKESKPSIIKEGIYKGDCSTKNKQRVAKSFGRFKDLNPDEKVQIKESLKSFTPKSTVKSWARMVFNDVNTSYAKYCMYEVQQGLFRKSK